MRNDRPVRRPTDELLRFAQNLVNLLVRQAARDVNVQKARRAASRKGARPHDNPHAVDGNVRRQDLRNGTHNRSEIALDIRSFPCTKHQCVTSFGIDHDVFQINRSQHVSRFRKILRILKTSDLPSCCQISVRPTT